MKTYLKYQPPAVQFLAFLGLAGGFLILNSAISSFFFNDISSVLLDKNAVVSPDLLGRFKLAQLAGSIISFIIPSLLFGYYSSPKSLPYIGVQKHASLILVGAAMLLLFTIQPFIGWLGEINSRIKFGSLQKSLLEMEAMYNRALQVFLQMKNFGDLLINLFIMALLPAIGEELFFRGSLQKALLRLSHKPWLAIVVSSLVFALLHGTFFKILPIFTLGLILGIVYTVTRNLWYTILIHFCNNAFAVLSVYYADRSETLKKLSNDDFSVPLYGAFVSLIIGIGIIYFIKKKSDEVLPAAITSDDNDYIA
ncbi:MAG: family intrarane metalloprotease [Segetibacter sp.]|jgi:membrane protease YdiL (CAAX protease family)|nr:family intrarane metalloprotease [Segetibacter sp.]